MADIVEFCDVKSVTAAGGRRFNTRAGTEEERPSRIKWKKSMVVGLIRNTFKSHLL